MATGAKIIEYAKQFIGVPYVWGGSSPKGFDCSGLVQYVYNHFGIRLSRTTKTQIDEGRPIGRDNLQLGDLVFPSNGHVTLYAGNNKVLHAPQPGDRVKISNLWSFWQARRILPDENYIAEINQMINEINNIYEEINSRRPTIPFGHFFLQTETCLHITGNNFEFLVGDYSHNGIPDVYCIKKNNTGKGYTEVHVLDGANNYKNYLIQTEIVCLKQMTIGNFV